VAQFSLYVKHDAEAATVRLCTPKI